MVAAPAGSSRPSAGGDSWHAVRVAAADGSPASQQVATRFLNPMQNAAARARRARGAGRRGDQGQQGTARCFAAGIGGSQCRASARCARPRRASRQLTTRVGGAAPRRAQPLEAQMAEAERALDSCQDARGREEQGGVAAAVASRDAEDAQAKAEEAAKIAERGTEPIAVFISRREGKVFVRQGMVPLFEAPVDVQGAEPPARHACVPGDVGGQRNRPHRLEGRDGAGERRLRSARRSRTAGRCGAASARRADRRHAVRRQGRARARRDGAGRQEARSPSGCGSTARSWSRTTASATRPARAPISSS